MHEAIHVSRTEHKAAAQLKWVSLYSVLAMPGSLGARTCSRVIAAEKVKDARTLQLHGTIRLAILVNEQRKVDSGFLAKFARKVSVAQADSGQRCAFVSDLLGVGAQLRDVLAAKDSPVMA